MWPVVGGILYNPSSGVFSLLSAMVFDICYPTGSLLTDGTILIAGGVQMVTGQNGGHSLLVTATAEIYDRATGTFTLTGSMSTDRYRPPATPLANGRVLIIGGANQTQTTRSAQIYDLVTGFPLPTTPMLSGRLCGQSVLLNGGQVRVEGVFDANRTGDSLLERFNPQTGSFFSCPPASSGGIQDFRAASGVAPGPAVPVSPLYLGRSSNATTIAVQ